MRHIDCADGANIDLLEYPLIHRRRDDGPPSPQSLPTSGMRGKVGVGVVSRHDDGPPTPSSRRRRATFPAIGKVYPTKLGEAEQAKVGVGAEPSFLEKVGTEKGAYARC